MITTPGLARHVARPLLALALLSSAAWAQAAYNAPISFGQSGMVTLTVDFSGGGYDHILELANTAGAIGATPLLSLTAPSPESASVLGVVPTPPGGTVLVGDFAAGAEIVFRLTNVESGRLGNPGTLGGQVFTGSSDGLNADPGKFHTLVETLSPTAVRVTFEDLFFTDPTSPTADQDFAGGKDVVFTLNMTPSVPEPESLVLALCGLGVIGMMGARRRRR